jgi:hypothetical protein
VDSSGDLDSLSNQVLKSLLGGLVVAEKRARLASKDVDESHTLRILRGRIDIIRAELVKRRRQGDDPGSDGAGVREPRRPRPSGDADLVEPPSDEADD